MEPPRSVSILVANQSCYCHSGFFKQVPEEIHNVSRLASPGTCLFLGFPVVGSRWGGMVEGALPAAAAQPESLALQLKFMPLYWNQILLSRVCFLLLLIFVYKTQGSHQSPQRLCQASLWHTPLPSRHYISNFLATLRGSGVFCVNLSWTLYFPVAEGSWGGDPHSA